MKKNLILSMSLLALGVTHSLYADSTLPTPPPSNGFYVSGGLGYGGLFLPNPATKLSLQKAGLTGQTAVGYFWHDGTIQYGPELAFSADSHREIEGTAFQANYASYNTSLLGVLKNNITNRWHIEGKAGISYVFQELSTTFISANTQKELHPEVVAGIGYNLTPSVSTDLTASWIFGQKPLATDGTSKQVNTDLNRVSSVGTLLLNISYAFQ